MNETDETHQAGRPTAAGETSKAPERDRRTRMDSADDRDFRAGFGVWSDELADRVREARERRKRKSRRRMGQSSEE